MSDREKLLGIIVGSLLAIFLMFGVYTMVNSSLKKKRNEIIGLNRKLKTEKNINLSALRDQQTVGEFHKRSLVAEPRDAHLEFSGWLEQQVNEVGLQKDNVSFDNIPNTKEQFKELSYRISGLGDIRQVTQLLYRIHSADTLHRVRTVDLVKQKDSDLLKVNVRVDALSMYDMDNVTKTAVGTVDETKLAHSLVDYEDIITSRNMFSPANRAPKFASLGRQRVEVDKRWKFTVKATDPEEHNLTFQLDEDAPEGMNISESGELSWRPKEMGSYEFGVLVRDNGIPAQEKMATMKVRVIEQEKEEEKKEEEFDDSKVAFLTAILQGSRDPAPRMCIHLRSKDETQYLEKGDKLKIGKWSGEIISIDADRNIVRLSTEDGEFELRLGEPLADARPL